MAMVQRDHSPKNRVEVGDAILAASKLAPMGNLGPRLKAFAASHAAFSKAEAVVRKADERLRASQAKSGQADAVQDAEVERLASGLAGDGYPRTNPFKILGFPSPSEVTELGHAAEAKVIHKLVAAVKKRKDVSKNTLAIAERADKAARAVEAALKPIDALAKARTKAIAAREALEQDWEYRFASLKLAAKLAAAEGDGRALEALFQVATPAPKRRAKVTKGKAPRGSATTPEAAPPG